MQSKDIKRVAAMVAPSPRRSGQHLFVGLLCCALLVLSGCMSGSDNNRPNNAPIADAGDALEVMHARAVQLDGSQSQDSDGTELSFQWSITQAPAGSNGTFDDSTSATPIFTPDRDGLYELTLLVSDGEATSTDTVNVTAFTRIVVFGDYDAPSIATALRQGMPEVRVEELGGYPVSRAAVASANYVAWLDQRDSVEAVYGQVLATGEERVIYSIGYRGSITDDLSMSGSVIAWSAYDSVSDEYSVHAYDFATDVATVIASASTLRFGVSIGGDIIAWRDDRNGASDVYAYNMSTEVEFRVNTNLGTAFGPVVAQDGSIIVFVDFRNGNSDIFRYDVSAGMESVVVSDTAAQSNPRIAGDYIVWSDARVPSGVYGYQISATTEFPIATGAGTPFLSAVSPTHVVWRDSRTGNLDLYGYDFTTTLEFPISTDPATPERIRVAGDLVVFDEYRSGQRRAFAYQISTQMEFELSGSGAPAEAVVIGGTRLFWEENERGYPDIYSSDDLGVTTTNHTAAKSFLSDPAIASRYHVAVFGDGLQSAYGLSALDAADAAGTGVLSMGTYNSGNPLSTLLADDGRFGITYNYDFACSEMEIDVSADGQGHPIFEGLSTTSTLLLESAGGEADEQVVFFDLLAADTPADLSVLADLGANMCFSGDAAIVTFTGPGGGRVILDGSANTYDGYVYWLPDRWVLLQQEVEWLAGLR